ncbi:mucin-13b isoform X8 [Xyrichtys novacula]|uniref:Mucin-13b isoform X8 n=1 Tax=Xyrichtys novacula TaxID=13765 RepID=A0AAV1H8S4_XYRNO|nr:mucin-13b isoform X8 [Xyrichtys novacula]
MVQPQNLLHLNRQLQGEVTVVQPQNLLHLNRQLQGEVTVVQPQNLLHLNRQLQGEVTVVQPQNLLHLNRQLQGEVTVVQPQNLLHLNRQLQGEVTVVQPQNLLHLNRQLQGEVTVVQPQNLLHLNRQLQGEVTVVQPQNLLHLNRQLQREVMVVQPQNLLHLLPKHQGDLCEGNACDATTTTCTPAEGSFVCNCLAGYIKTTYAQRMCTACPSGEKASSDKCVPCSFGYSGFNCNESWKLVLVIVGSVFGGLLLLSVIGMIVMARRPAKKSSKKVKGENVNGFSTKAPLVSDSSANNRAAAVNGPANSFSNAGVPRIPRATTANSLDGRTNLEMTPSNSRQGFNPAAGRNPRLYDDPDDLKPYSQSRPQSSHYAQSRPQSNPYAQSRPQTNPYASNQGYANPYYKHDDGRRLY